MGLPAAPALVLAAVAGAGLQFLAGRVLGRHRRPKRPAEEKDPWAVAPRYVDAPHTAWRPADPQPSPYGQEKEDFVQIDPGTMEKAALYTFFISAIAPRPVAFVSSVSADGQRNLSPYSYFNGMGHNPPILAIGCCRSPDRGGGKKDTLLNIEETKEFVVNLMSEWFVEAANHTCGSYPRGVDEWALSGLTPLPSDLVAPPRVAEAGVAAECRLRQVIEFNDPKTGAPSLAVVLAEVVRFHVNKGVTGTSPTGKLVVDPVKMAAVSRLGGVTYGRTSELYDIPRPGGGGTYPGGLVGPFT